MHPRHTFLSPLLMATAMAFVPQAHAQTQVVAPDSHFFKDWVFTQKAGPAFQQTPLGAGAVNTDISLAGRTLTVTNLGPHNPGDEFNVITSFTWGGSSPANIDLPQTRPPANVDISRGDGSLMFSAPLPRGTVLFITDVDAKEHFDLKFVDCQSKPVDAGGFTPLQISLTSPVPPHKANNMPNFNLQGSAPSSYWRVADPVPSGGGVSQTTNGIIINSSQVCGVNIAGNRARGTGGGAQFSFGVSPAALAASAATAVPTLSHMGLAMLGLALGGLGWLRRRHG